MQRFLKECKTWSQFRFFYWLLGYLKNCREFGRQVKSCYRITFFKCDKIFICLQNTYRQRYADRVFSSKIILLLVLVRTIALTLSTHLRLADFIIFIFLPFEERRSHRMFSFALTKCMRMTAKIKFKSPVKF